MNHLENSLEAFFTGEERVAVIKGDWGVGKTYFWEHYISEKIESGTLPQIAYSYISLFGNSSLDELRKNVFHNAKAIKSDEQIDDAFQRKFSESSLLLNKVPWIQEGVDKAQSKAPLLGWFTKHSKNIPFIDKFSGIISSLEYSLVNNYIVCIDDLERKGKGLSIKEVMGFADELSQRKECKVILIFNDSSFDNDEDKLQFELYREKVVDIEINHNPTCKENLSCIFTQDLERYSVLENVANELNIKNIRVIRKIKLIYESFDEYIHDSDHKIIDEFIVHATLLCWSYYIRDNELTYETLKENLSSKSWLSFFRDNNDEVSPGEKKYRSLASRMHLSGSVFDSHIIFFLENGYIDRENLEKTVSEFKEKVRIDTVSSRISGAWDIYSDSFEDNLREFKDSLIAILNEDMPRLGLSDFSSAIDILGDFDENIDEFIDRYIKIHTESLSEISSRYSSELRRIKCQSLKEKIEELNNKNKNHNIDDISMKIATNSSWSSEDIEFLDSLSKDDYFKWMKGSPDDLVTKVRGGLLIFRNIQSTDSVQGKYANISANVIAALKEIASENELNRRRVKFIYEIE